MNQSHLEWDLEPAPDGPFGAQIRQRKLNGISFIDCHCDPCSGYRRRPQIGRTDAAYFGVLFELRGREIIRQGGEEVVLSPGDSEMWGVDAEKLAGKIVRGSENADGIAAEALRRVARDFAVMPEQSAGMILDPILSLVSATLSTRIDRATPSAGHEDSFRKFCTFMDTNLGDLTLTPSAAADAHGISLRYLHLVFAEQGPSFARLLRRKRLARCHRDLSQVRRASTDGPGSCSVPIG